MRWRRVAVVAGIVLLAVVLVGAGYFGHLLPGTQRPAGSATIAPEFTLPSIYGQNFTLGSYENTSVVVIEFTALSCSECQIVEQSLYQLYSGYNASGHTDVHIVSIYIEPQYGDTIPALHTYHDKNNITWTMAQDTNSLAVSRAYGVTDIPTVFVVDPHEHVVYDVSGVQNDQQLQSTIGSALAGTAAPISIITVSVYVLAVIAGVSTFFSPCAFPMFPGYMGLFLGMNAKDEEANGATAPTYSRAARRAAFAGSITALGMILVFLVVGVVLLLAARTVAAYIPDLLIAVGVVLVTLGALLLTNLQYWRVIAPLQQLWYRLGGRRPEENLATPTAGSGQAFNLKLFSYGMGYAAAAAGCVFPVILASIVAGLSLGLVGGILNVVIFSATTALLMIGVTVALGVAGKRYVNRLKALAPAIKKVSAVALIVVGVYLIYFFYTAWGF